MKRFSAFLLVLLCLQACEKVVDVDLTTEKPKLVIEATGIQNGSSGMGEFTVKLTKTAPFFGDTVPKVNGAQIQLKVQGQTIVIPEITGKPGVYKEAVPMVYDADYELVITVEGEEYRGETQLYRTVPIDYISQEEGIFDSDKTQLKVYYTDPPGERNYYLISFISKHGQALSASDDEFYDGNQVQALYTEDFDPGDTVNVRINGTGKGFNRYISILLSQSGQSGNPFATAPATVRGNMKNIDHPDKFPLGYFRMSQAFKKVYVVE